MKFHLTNDPIVGRSVNDASKYQPIFDALIPANPCVVFDDIKDAERFKQRLDVWAEKHVKGSKARSTIKYPGDGKPRVWLVYPQTAQPVKTSIRGPFPKA
jgi:hypothetical protein